MKTFLPLCLAILLVLSACNSGMNVPNAAEPEPVSRLKDGEEGGALAPVPVDSLFTGKELEALMEPYYAAQGTKAFRMLHKSIFIRLLPGWVRADLGGGITNPKWNFDSFAAYKTLSATTGVPESGGELYCCTFSADGDRHGYVVLEYIADGPALRKLTMVETPYNFDLLANIWTVAPLLADTDLDHASTTATRAQLLPTETNAADEGIWFADSKGNSCFYSFESRDIVLVQGQ